MQFQLNEGQDRISAMGHDHIRRGYDQVFQFGGYAGSGKSVVLFDIFRRTGWNIDDILPLAFTGQAAIIMRMKGFVNATTCHSGLFDVVDIPIEENGRTRINTHFNVPEMGLKFVPKKELKNKKAIFIDEGSMIPLSMKPIIEKFGLPVIVAGDPGQLGPVKDYPAYLLSTDKYPILEQLMRQAENDPIVYLARRARLGLPINTGLYGNNVLVIEESDVTDTMFLNSNMILCGKNTSREHINHRVRNDILHIHNSLPVFGDRMICRKNNHYNTIAGISLANGLMGTVVSQPDAIHFDRKNYIMDFLPDLLQVPFRNLSCDYKFLTTPIKEREYDKFATGEKFEFAYAITTHLSQGAEAPNGMYFEEYMPADMQSRINYTAITRFKNSLIYVKPNRKKIFFF